VPVAPQLVDFVRRFEPVMYFHASEQFFPVDPKRYIEESALWRTRRPTRTRDDWGEEPPGVFPKRPLRPRGGLAAANTNPSELGTDTWLGDLLPAEPAREDRFLALGTWEDATSVSTSTLNRRASLNAIANAYRPDVSPGLNRSRFWYYAEIFDAALLERLLRQDAEGAPDIDFFSVLRALENPVLICYHLFYPAHEDPLLGCQSFGQAGQFASFAGEWTCVAVLVEGGTPTTAGRPTHIGLTQRNVGTLDARDDETRIGMTVQPWEKVTTIDGHPEHPRLFVAQGTHSYYLTTGTGIQTVTPFTSEGFDVGRSRCSDVEALDGILSPPDPPPHQVPVWLALGKLLVGPGGWLGLAFEFAATVAPFTPFTADPPPVAAPVDFTASGTMFGRAIRPSGIPMSEIVSTSTPVTRTETWRTSVADAPDGEITVDGRGYGFIVNRDTQVWWPTRHVDEAHRRGFNGRWGPVVDQDPKNRRSGMRVPRFWLMFMIALARKK
jgi:hypothetical protein